VEVLRKNKFIEENKLQEKITKILKELDFQNTSKIINASEKIRYLILNASLSNEFIEEIMKEFKNLESEFVAVRSSATSEDSSDAAWAGQLESYLNTTEKNLLDNVKKCWASLFTPRAIIYRKEKDLNETQISVAVVVQKMIESECSGIAFSVHPVTQDRNQVIIEAGFGLGEAIVSGQITPDEYIVEKNSRKMINKKVVMQERGLYRDYNGGNEWKQISKVNGEKQVLSEAEIIELTELILRIEYHYGFPCDIEWAKEKGKFYIVQSRPITTLVNSNKDSFLEKKWTKIWTTEYSLFSVWLFGREYSEDCKNELGFGFEDIIFLVEGDLATVYRDNEKQKEFVQFLAEKSLMDPNFKERCLNIYYDLNRRLNEYIQLPEKTAIISENLEEFIKLHRKFIAYFLVPLWSPNGFDKFDVSEETKKSIYQEYETARKLTEHTYPEIEKFLQRIFLYISKKESITEKYLRALLPEELIEYSKTGKLPEENVLKERYDYCVLLSNLNENKIVLGKEGKEIIEKISAIDTKGISEIKGSIANKGKVIGNVRKIFMEKEMHTFNPEEILVTTMTRPEWLPIMKKAAGFITDAGGILSHAAIVSRELNKPCIIGTGTATQILKDGDLVELDANNGIVKILKSS